MLLGKLDSHMQNNDTGLFSYNIFRGKMVKESNVRPETTKYGQENIGSIFFFVLRPRDIFLDMFPQARVRKAKINGTMSNKTTFVQPKKPSK